MGFLDSFILNTIVDTVTCGRLVRDKGHRLPNVEMATMGGKVFWRDLAEKNGYRLQKNSVTGHCRILDYNDKRKAWGSEAAMRQELNGLVTDSD